MWYLFGLDKYGRPIFDDSDVIDVDYEDLTDEANYEPDYV